MRRCHRQAERISTFQYKNDCHGKRWPQLGETRMDRMSGCHKKCGKRARREPVRRLRASRRCVSARTRGAADFVEVVVVMPSKSGGTPVVVLQQATQALAAGDVLRAKRRARWRMGRGGGAGVAAGKALGALGGWTARLCSGFHDRHCQWKCWRRLGDGPLAYARGSMSGIASEDTGGAWGTGRSLMLGVRGGIQRRTGGVDLATLGVRLTKSASRA